MVNKDRMKLFKRRIIASEKKENAISLISPSCELLGRRGILIRAMYGDPDRLRMVKWTYVLKKGKFGLFSKQLHLYLISDEVVDYDVERYILGMRIPTMIQITGKLI